MLEGAVWRTSSLHRLHREGDQRPPIIRMDVLQQNQELRWHAIQHSQDAPEFGSPVKLAGIEVDLEDSNVWYAPSLHHRRSSSLISNLSIALLMKLQPR